MSAIPKLRTSLAYLLVFSLFVAGLLTLATHQSRASNKSLALALPPSVKESSEETAPQADTVNEATRSRVSETYGKLPLSFEENRGQVDEQVKYLSRGSDYTLFLTPTEAVLTLSSSDGEKAATTADAQRSTAPAQPPPTRTSVLRMKLRGANQSLAITGESEMGVKTNYFKGNDPQKWQTDVARYERVRYSQVYPGVDMIYYGRQQQLEYDFEVAPGADASRIAVEFEGVKRVKVERKTGDLILKTVGGEVRQRKPVAYQEAGGERREVASRYVVNGKREVKIEVGKYNHAQRLVIDPVLSFSTHLGGFSIAVDPAGHAYVTASTPSNKFPRLHAYQGDQRGYDAFVTKLDTNSSGAASLLYSTYLGGYDNDYGLGIAVDPSGHAYVTGYTKSADFPTKNQYQTDREGEDAFITKLDTNAAGAASLLYSTYLGGSGTDEGQGIAIDSSGNAYVTGDTSSPDFPTLSQYQTLKGPTDVFVTKINTNAAGAASLLYSTYLGGGNTDGGLGGYDYGRAIAVDASGNAYVTGITYSTDFPTKNQYQISSGGDAFVTRLDTNASGAASLRYSTYLGGSDWDYGFGIAADSAGNAYVTGTTGSFDFPMKNQYQTFQSANTHTDAFVTKINTNATGAASLLYSTYLGGGPTYYGSYGDDHGRSIAIDASSNVYVTGWTDSENFPMKNQYQTFQSGNGYTDAFVAKLNPNLSGEASLLYSTYLGGDTHDRGYGIAVDSSGHAYVTGTTGSFDFPTLNPTYPQGFGSFVTKLTDSYIISGRVMKDGATGIGYATVTISGSIDKTVSTDSNGNYSIQLVAGSDYTITPSKDGLIFVPSQQSFTNLQENHTNVNFITRPVTIRGKVTKDTATGAGFPGVTITLTGSEGFTPRTVTTSSDGTYVFSNVPEPRNYRITPSKINYAFSPAQIFLSNVTTDQTNKRFIATLTYYRISGVVKLGADGQAGVTVTLTSPTPTGFPPRSTTTDSAGAYSFTLVPAGRNYTVTPQKTGYQFMPASTSLTNLTANQIVNFAVVKYSITGRVTWTDTTTGIEAVTVTITSPTPAGFTALTKQTSSTGYYTFWMSLPPGRDYTITPSKSGFTFSPQTRQITNLSNNIGAGAATNFTGAGP